MGGRPQDPQICSLSLGVHWPRSWRAGHWRRPMGAGCWKQKHRHWRGIHKNGKRTPGDVGRCPPVCIILKDKVGSALDSSSAAETCLASWSFYLHCLHPLPTQVLPQEPQPQLHRAFLPACPAAACLPKTPFSPCHSLFKNLQRLLIALMISWKLLSLIFEAPQKSILKIFLCS